VKREKQRVLSVLCYLTKRLP